MFQITTLARASGSVQRRDFFQPTLGPLPGWTAVPMAISANRSQLIWSPVLGWALLSSCLVSGVQAQEETTTPGLQTLEQEAPGEVIDILLPTTTEGGGGGGDRRGELGIAMGAFTLFPSLEILGGYDSNVFATSAPTVGSPFTVVKPQVELKSEWLNHSLRVLASGGFGFYVSAPTQNFQNYSLVADGKFDIREDLSGKISTSRPRSAPSEPPKRWERLTCRSRRRRPSWIQSRSRSRSTRNSTGSTTS
ncbi:MAG: hypothetical protein EXR12_01520 [Rhodospirillaceae bacterium]|nr:hypothetical protein [Rhodospirillaceae bacterium]